MAGLNQRQHDTYFEILLKMYPEQKCFNCGKTPADYGLLKHEIHHVDGDDTNNDPLNLLWACHGCNHRKEFRKINLLGRRDMTPEQRKSEERKPVYYQWIWQTLQEKQGHYNLEQLIDGGAYLFKVDVVTTKRWLKPLYSDFGPYKLIAFGRLGETHLCVKGKSFDLEDMPLS